MIHKTQLEIEEFQPLFNFFTGHTQTVLGHIMPSNPLGFAVEKEIFNLADSDQIQLEYKQGSQPYTLSLFHGLGGDAQADYIRRSAAIAFDMGWNVILVNHRGSLPHLKANKTYHSGRGEDAEQVIAWARKKFPNTKQFALGFSMSGSILLNLLSYRHGYEQPDAAVVVNAPLRLDRSSELLRKGFSKIYDYRFYLILKKIILEKDPDQKLPLFGPTVQIDRLYTAPKNGFSDENDYYNKCSAWEHVGKIKTPTFVLTSMDDPFVDFTNYQTAVWNENVHLTYQKYGGHMGYYSKKNDPKYGRRWLDQYLRSVFEKLQII